MCDLNTLRRYYNTHNYFKINNIWTNQFVKGIHIPNKYYYSYGFINKKSYNEGQLSHLNSSGKQ